MDDKGITVILHHCWRTCILIGGMTFEAASDAAARTIKPRLTKVNWPTTIAAEVGVTRCRPVHAEARAHTS
jgi:hypothetical protein